MKRSTLGRIAMRLITRPRLVGKADILPLEVRLKFGRGFVPCQSRLLRLASLGRLAAVSPPRLRLNRPRPQRLFHALGDFAQVRVARLATGAARIEVALKTVALRPMLGEELEARVLDRLDGARELNLRTPDLRQNEDEPPFGAPAREPAREIERRPQVVLRHAGWQEYDLGILGDFSREVVGEATGVGDNEIDPAVLLAKLL